MNSRQIGELLFGTAGVPVSAKLRSTGAGVERIAELGLGCMEVEFVQGVKMTPKAAASVRELAAQKQVALTAHGPYFINLNAQEPEKVAQSKERILQTARIGAFLGARSITFHAAFYLKSSPAETYSVVKKHLQDVVNTLKREGNKVKICPEVTGKPTQFGTLEEVLQLSAEIEGVGICLDFSHWHARTGKANSYEEFLGILDQVERRLGREALDEMHIHVSGIAYGQKGEIKHLMLPESDFRYIELLKALKERKVKGIVISESIPYLEKDALLLQQAYRQLP